jgi:hypothetical protein
MMKRIVKAIGAMVAAYAVLRGLTIGFHVLVGMRMLDAAEWMSGTPVPVSYIVVMSAVALTAGTLAGLLVGRIIGDGALLYAIEFGALFCGLAAWAAWDSLPSGGHLDEWILVLAPLVALPLGAWLYARRDSNPQPPDPKSGTLSN